MEVLHNCLCVGLASPEGDEELSVSAHSYPAVPMEVSNRSRHWPHDQTFETRLRSSFEISARKRQANWDAPDPSSYQSRRTFLHAELFEQPHSHYIGENDEGQEEEDIDNRHQPEGGMLRIDYGTHNPQ